jgi:hypothetical protein
MPVLIQELYDSGEQQNIKKLYKDDPSLHELIKKALGQKILEKKDKILTTNALDILCFLCLNSPFADDENECYTVSVLLYKNIKTLDILPLVTEEHGLNLASKCLVSLSLFSDRLEWRRQRYGYPGADYYRKVSTLILKQYDHNNVAKHHRLWEQFIGEMFTL